MNKFILATAAVAFSASAAFAGTYGSTDTSDPDPFVPVAAQSSSVPPIWVPFVAVPLAACAVACNNGGGGGSGNPGTTTTTVTAGN